MPAQFDLSKLSVRQFAERFRGEMIPLSNTFSYFCASVPMSEEDLKEYLEEPIAALPAAVAAALPKISIFLVPYLERGDAAEKKKAPAASRADYVSIERPPDELLSTSTQLKLGEETVLAFALKDQEVAEYHYRLFHLLATLMADRRSDDVENRYGRIVREEISADVHGEVDEPSWRLKQSLRRSGGTRAHPTGQGVQRIRLAVLYRYAYPLPARHLLRYRCRHRPTPAAEPLSAQAPHAARRVVPASQGLRGFSGTAGILTEAFRRVRHRRIYPRSPARRRFPHLDRHAGADASRAR